MFHVKVIQIETDICPGTEVADAPPGSCSSAEERGAVRRDPASRRLREVRGVNPRAFPLSRCLDPPVSARFCALLDGRDSVGLLHSLWRPASCGVNREGRKECAF